ncbi:MAG TPA: imidazole glycerol phosphate synthase subunit HisH [Clostridiales bacterium]|jgi:glutamine amidotransferase|nr:imidazole glycerol phosphate synthase subunit HisH [Clostridiales bacterium]
MTVIIDYGVGNLFSLSSSLEYIGEAEKVSGDPEEIRRADRIILPGVGAFGDAAAKLKETGLDRVIVEEAKAGKPLLGICLGMQLLFLRSYEFGEHAGLGLIPGSVRPIKEVVGEELKVPQIGWNRLFFPEDKPKSRLYRYTREGEFVYFVHSYHGADCKEYISAYTEYGAPLTASVENAAGNVFGTQYHPEKSGRVGLGILRAFCEIGGRQ